MEFNCIMKIEDNSQIRIMHQKRKKLFFRWNHRTKTLNATAIVLLVCLCAASSLGPVVSAQSLFLPGDAAADASQTNAADVDVIESTPAKTASAGGGLFLPLLANYFPERILAENGGQNNNNNNRSSDCNSLSSCINQLVLNSLLIREPLTYLAPAKQQQQLIGKGELAGSEKPPVKGPSEQHNPIIFVPGDGGSQLEARLNKTSRVHYFCSQQSDWYSIWLNVHLLAPVVIDCFYDNFRLHYNSTSRLTQNTAGVEIRARNFGSLESVAYLDARHMPKTDYFETLVSEFEKSNNLTRDVDMSGASFDFRKAPNELDAWLTNLTHLIEAKYVSSNYKPVTLVCHSMGCMNAVYLLNQKTQVWKDIFVKRLVALASPWGGSFKAISAMLFGDTLGIPLLDARKLRVLQASWPSLMYLFPRQEAFASNQTLVQTPEFNYSLETLDGLFLEANMTDQRDLWHITRDYANSLRAPQVELWCLAGSEVQTPFQLTVDTPIKDAIHTFKYQEQMADGDGTVNIESSEVCLRWAQEQEKPVYYRKFPGIDHISMARDPRPAKYISQNILSRDLKPETES